MKDITDKVTTFRLAKDVAKELNVSPVTLKKYSLLIEKLSEGAVLFQRNGNQSRVYTVPDVLLIRRTLDLREKEGITYENAVLKALQEGGYLPVLPVPNDRTPPVPSDAEFDRTVHTLLAVLKEQNGKIDKLIQANKELIKTNNELSRQIQLFLERAPLREGKEEKITLDKAKEEEKNPPKKKWWIFWK